MTNRIVSSAALAVALGLGAPAMAQTQTQAPPYTATGVRPGNIVGTGQSLPMSNRASNIDQSDTRSTIAPNLPSPPVAPDSPPEAYLRAARGALAAGQTGEAQQSLEMAETRLLDRSVPYDAAGVAIHDPRLAIIEQARRALATGDRAGAIGFIDQAMRAPS
jgi:hypothetical protein